MVVAWTWEEEEDVIGTRTRGAAAQDGSKGGGQGGMEEEGKGGEVWEGRSIDGGEAWWSRCQALSMYRERTRETGAHGRGE